MDHNKAIPVENLEQAIIERAGEAPKKGFGHTGNYDTAWGKNNKFRSAIDPQGRWACFYNWSTKDKQTFYKKGTNPKTIKLPRLSNNEIKLCDVEFNKLSKNPQDDHPYFKAKGITATGLNIRFMGNKVVIPIYSTEGQVISWQTIGPNPKSKENKKFKAGHRLSQGHHFPIGKATDRVFVCEGLATGASIHKITGQAVYCAFSKGNLDNVVRYCQLGFPKAQVVLALDNDGEKTHEPKVKGILTLCPNLPKGKDEADFNDVQKDIFEREKLIACQPAWTPPETKKELPREAILLQKRFSKLGYELRLNTRKDRIEIKGFTSKKWDEVTDEGYSRLFLEAKGEGGNLTKTAFEDRYKTLAHSKQVDPFQEYLNDLEWDGNPRLERFLFDVFEVAVVKHTPLAKWAFKSILLATVRRAFEPGSKHDEFVILKGAQGIGKSSLLYHLFEDKSLFSNTVSFADPYPRIVEGILDKGIIEVAECAGFKKAELEKMKNVITTQKDTVRLPYRRNARDYQRRCVFVATTNDVAPLPDDLTGLRRFVPVDLKEKMGVNELKKLVKENRDQLWAEAVHCYKQGESARLPKDLWELSAEVAEMHRGGDHSFEQAFLNEIEGKEWVNIPEVLKKLKDGEQAFGENKKSGGWIKDISKINQNKAAEILKKAGYEDKGRIQHEGKRMRMWHRPKAGKCPF